MYSHILPFFQSFVALYLFFITSIGHGNIPKGHNERLVDEKVTEIFGENSSEVKALSFKSGSLKDLNKEFDELVKKSIDDDRTCLKVVTGNDGEKKLGEIEKKFGVGGNVSENKDFKVKDYPTFMARNFLNMLCQNREIVSSDKMRSEFTKNLKEIHPYKRTFVNTVDKTNDALSEKGFWEPLDNIPELSKLSLSENGIHNLIYGQALVYSLVIRESNSKLLTLDTERFKDFLAGESRKTAFQQKVGLCHQSANSLGTRYDLQTKSPSNTIFPFAMDLLKKYIKKARYLAEDKSPRAHKRFSDFCGTSNFDQRYKEKKIDPKESLRLILSSTSEFKKKYSSAKQLVTCDEILEDGVSSYDAGNVHSCYMALQEFCPNYSVAHANLVVRGIRKNNGPLHRTSLGVRPACHKLFYSIYDRVNKGEDLCRLAEDFSLQ